MSVLKALEDEIARVIKASAELKSDFGDPVRIVENETTRAAFPFMRFARHDVRPEADSVGELSQHRLTIEMFCRSGGRDEASRLLGVLSHVLRSADLTPDGYRVVLSYPVYSDVFLRPDGTTHRGLLRLRTLTEPVSD